MANHIALHCTLGSGWMYGCAAGSGTELTPFARGVRAYAERRGRRARALAEGQAGGWAREWRGVYMCKSVFSGKLGRDVLTPW
jgi:hypothetical protein